MAAAVLEGFAANDTIELITAIQRAVKSCAPALIAIDARFSVVLNPLVAEHCGQLMRETPDVERTAFLVAEQRGVVNLQIDRMIRLGRAVPRQTFTHVDAMVAWFAEVDGDDARLLARAWGGR